ncbi:thiamine pyrophosphate-binding protein [Rhodothermus marinus]|uniref:thiamine pyrophosphate-binding protein n=1 Tax=Rhodothermus marinus TaxID=29549 RepID=UPI0012BA4250|nr:thiamine pyrophosphate-binding protein [Rhodothermus marinus]BBM69760.1 acetolactate synthase [Rhodothermus marinus]BBM72746.1 acetolactate synthase [Rhodothermus marinus]
MPKKSGAWLIRYALEQLPVPFTFGIPGVHVTELYDELGRSERVRPVLVTHEGGGAFMADAVSRVAPDRIGALAIVPAAGAALAMGGMGEAYLAGVPMLVVSGGIRTDIPFHFQLHEIDQEKLVSAVTKGFWRVTRHAEIVPTIFEAYRTAVSGVPGPVFVEVPVNVQLFQGEVPTLPAFTPPPPSEAPDDALIEEAARVLAEAERPGIFVGWGAVDATEPLIEIAERLGAPVATTLQGLSAFPGNHPLHAGMGFSRAAVPAAERAFEDCDALLAVGTRFAEIPTGSFGVRVPEALVHIDLDPGVLGVNYPACVAIAGDSRVVLPRLLEALRAMGVDRRERREAVARQIRADKQAYRDEWYRHDSGARVNPVRFFDALRAVLPDEAIVTVDDGNHTYLTAELFEVRRPRTLIVPTDFNCMGYAVPAAVGAKLAHPDRPVVAVVGDGAFLMTGLELLTARRMGVGVVCCVFHDGELSQISQGQEIPYNRKTCTVIGEVRLDGIARAVDARYVRLQGEPAVLERTLREALAWAQGGDVVVVDVPIDYSRRTRFTRGVVKTVLARFPTGDRLRFVGRALWRRLRG